MNNDDIQTYIELSVDMPVVGTINKWSPVGFRRVSKILESFYGFNHPTVISSIVRLVESGAIGMCDGRNDCHMRNNADHDEVFIICDMDKCYSWVGRHKPVKT